MARIFRQCYTVANRKTGQRETKRTKNWYIEYRDEHGKPKVVPGYKDRKSTDQKAADLERTAERIRAGLLTPAVEFAATDVTQHIADYAAALESKGDTPKHVAITRKRLETLAQHAKWGRLVDLDQSSVLAFLAKCRSGLGPTPDGRAPFQMSRETCNHYIRAARAFGAWLTRPPQRSAVNPFAGMVTLNPEVDRRVVRRSLTEDEFARLLTATRQRPFARCGMVGADREILYLLAAYTGLRLAELGSLTVGSLHLGARPTVSVSAADEKSGRGAELPIPAVIAKRVKLWLRGRKCVFLPGPWLNHAARMLRGDLAAAGVPWRDERRRVVDFHSFRSQFATALARAGVDLRVTQKLLRHSTPILTAKHYTKLDLDDLADAAAKLPAPGSGLDR